MIPVLLILLSVCIGSPVYSGVGTTGANFLKINIGPRPVSMGETFVAIGNDVNTIFYNPAGLGLLSGTEISFSHIDYFQDVKYETLASAFALPSGCIGAAAGYLYIKEIPKTKTEPTSALGYTEEGTFSVNNKTILLSYGIRVSAKTLLGFGARYFTETLSDKTAQAWCINLGLLSNIDKQWDAGIAILNVGGGIKFVDKEALLPILVRAGVAHKTPDNKIRASFELIQAIDTQMEYHLGGEYSPIDALSLRIGYRLRPDENYKLGYLSGLTAGIGFKTLIYYIDYAFVPYGDIGYTHRISLSLKFTH